ncbi:hypothetical protein AgCh_013717 [Apium graveolens]
MTATKPPALPKFGEWDVKDPGQAQFSVIFEKARDAKREGHPHNFNPNSPLLKKEPQPETTTNNRNAQDRRSRFGCRRWFCCCAAPTRYAES